jgi:SAM-dependent MidA family methyltransferase
VSNPASSIPQWLQQRLEAAGGAVPFSTYMEWVLHDPEHGAYGSGRLQIGPRGDFATSPSLGPDFAALLAPQLAAWLEQLGAQDPSAPLSLVETGPGEGTLALQLARELSVGWPHLAARCELVLVEPNAGMVARQRRQLEACPLPVRWSSFAALAAAPLWGVVLAHEVLDALAVERFSSDGERWCRQLVRLESQSSDGSARLRLAAGAPLSDGELALLEPLHLQAPGPQRPTGWTSELHTGLQPWLADAAASLRNGWLLVVDYALEAWRYYAPSRLDGTLMAYRQQRAFSDPLVDPGQCDLTAHLCIEQLEAAARAAGWHGLGQCRQGEALLALGLAQRLHGLQHGATPDQLGELLGRREALLRLVDPQALGDFRWLAFARGAAAAAPTPSFLSEPPRE